MKRMFLIIIMIGVSFSLFSCGGSSSKPSIGTTTIKGTKVELTKKELENKLETLTKYFVPNNLLRFYYKASETTFNSIDGYDKGDYYLDRYLNHNKKSTWTIANYSNEYDDSSYNVKVNAFEDEKNVYMDTTYKETGKLTAEQGLLCNVNSGRYKISKTVIAEEMKEQTIAKALLNVGIQERHDYSLFEYKSQLLTLTDKKYQGLTFYEDKTYFTISLKISLNDILTAAANIKTPLKEIGLLSGVQNESDLSSYEYNLVYVFKNKKLNEGSLKVKINNNSQGQIYNLDLILVTKYVKKVPSKDNYDKYKKIEDFEIIFPKR